MKYWVVLGVLVTLVCLTEVHGGGGGGEDLPPIRTEVKYQKGEKKEDDPEGAWEEWGESSETRHNAFPKRQREVKAGMNINSVLGMAMKQPKVVTAVLTPEFGKTNEIGQRVTQKFRDQLAAAGIGCRLWFVLEQGRQVVANCETIRDGHMAKDYMIRQKEIMRTVLDNIPFTPLPDPDDDDDDDDEKDDL